MKPETFLAFMEMFVPTIRDRGYFPSVFLAQSAVESGWGKSPLSAVYNFWGHKWKPEIDAGRYAWTNKLSNEEINGEMIPIDSRFRVYPDMEIAVQAYCDKWTETWKDGSPKYPDQDMSSPQAFVASIAAHYCNDSEYVDKITRIIREWDLEQYDREV